MKTLLACIALSFFTFPVFSQRIIFVESQTEYDLMTKQRLNIDIDNQMLSGLRTNNFLLQRIVQIGIKKDQKLEKIENDDLLIGFKVFMNKENKPDSLKFWFGAYNQKKFEFGGTYAFEYQVVDEHFQIDNFKQIFKEALKNCQFHYNPVLRYEINGNFKVNPFITKTKGSEVAIKNILATKDISTKELKLENLGLKSLPHEIYKFKDLVELNLSKNEFEALKINAKKLPNLRRIILTDNLLSERTLTIKRNKKIQVINLSDNYFTAFPKKIQKNRRLKELHLANNFIKQTNNVRFRRFGKLEFLNLYNNQIFRLSENIGKLKNLQVLDLYHNNLKSLPDGFTKLKKLETLAISNNNLWGIPHNMSQLISLKTIYAHHNKLSIFDSFPPNLEYLDIGFNLLETVPKHLNFAMKLTYLDISNNRIKSGAGVLSQVTKLKNVALSANDFESDPTKFAELQQIIVDLEKKSVSVK
ncbi:hypothetical protein EGI26_03595 [Lacihabitans sp. CCS-44]|uniref:leucine-rich repeat domain-containing protein n=1 Tax=Lacihabitans sp. CCS-44 TaxID=2487331 RepID=UPI0020CB9201|nr:leucine-rich repeat domain-containing protein [Lacihabitans sp. CCS-44]MCP9754247.1 hypothetical protein [Lacihabitans sp. CCS-44]